MSLDPNIPPLAAEKRIETIWLVKIELASTLLATNRREGYTDGGDVYAYQTGLSVGAIRRSPGEKAVCEVVFADANATMTWLPLNTTNQKKPVTIQRVWWDGASWVSEVYFAGLTGRASFEALWVRLECCQRLGRRGKGTNVAYAGLMTAHAPLAPNSKLQIEVPS